MRLTGPRSGDSIPQDLDASWRAQMRSVLQVIENIEMRATTRARIERAKLLINRPCEKKHPGYPPEDTRVAILRGLLGLQRRGKIDGVWYEDHSKRLSIKRSPFAPITRISWEEASTMIQAGMENGKPVLQSHTSEKEKTA